MPWGYPRNAGEGGQGDSVSLRVAGFVEPAVLGEFLPGPRAESFLRGLSEITWVACSAQCLVHGAQAVEKRLSATADVDDYNIKMENPERERTLRVSSCSSRELQRIGIPQ